MKTSQPVDMPAKLIDAEIYARTARGRETMNMALLSYRSALFACDSCKRIRREKECAVVDSRTHNSVKESPEFYDDLFAVDQDLGFPGRIPIYE